MRSRESLPRAIGQAACWSTPWTQDGCARTWAVRRHLARRRRAPIRLCGWPRCRTKVRRVDSSVIAAPSNGRRRRPAEDIATRAYAHFAERGFADGHDIDDWLEAEPELRSRPKDTASKSSR